MIIEASRWVTKKNGVRPAGPSDRCFYCDRLLGEAHTESCVLYLKSVTVRAIVEYVIRVPVSWDKYNVEFGRNESSWCANNGIDEIARIAAARDTTDERGVGFGPCMCALVRYEYVGDAETDTEDPDQKDDA